MVVFGGDVSSLKSSSRPKGKPYSAKFLKNNSSVIILWSSEGIDLSQTASDVQAHSRRFQYRLQCPRYVRFRATHHPLFQSLAFDLQKGDCRTGENTPWCPTETSLSYRSLEASSGSAFFEQKPHVVEQSLLVASPKSSNHRKEGTAVERRVHLNNVSRLFIPTTSRIHSKSIMMPTCF